MRHEVDLELLDSRTLLLICEDRSNEVKLGRGRLNHAQPVKDLE